MFMLCNSVVDFHSLLLLHYLEYNSFYKSELLSCMPLPKLACQAPALYCRRFWGLVWINSNIQSLEGIVGHSSKVGMELFVMSHMHSYASPLG